MRFTPRMGRLFLFLATATAACVGKTEAPAESWADRVEVKVEAVAATGEAPAGLQVTLSPVEGWSLNTAYPGVKVELAEAVPVKQRLLKKADGRFEGKKPGDKAERLVLRTALDEGAELPAKVEGTFKAVICTKATCSPPFTGTFAEAPAEAAADTPAKKQPAGAKGEEG